MQMTKHAGLILFCLWGSFLALGTADPAYADIRGPYHFVLLETQQPEGGAIEDVRILSGEITFQSSSRYSFEGRLAEGSTRTPLTGLGDYGISGFGEITLKSPLTPDATIDVKIGADSDVLLGVDAEGSNGSTLFVAVRTSESAPVLSGSYSLSKIGFLSATQVAVASVTLQDVGSGRVGSVGVNGGVIGQGGSSERVDSGLYALGADGAGVFQFPDGESTLVGSSYELFATPDGSILIGSSLTESRELFFGFRAADVSSAAVRGNRYWIAEWTLTDGALSSGVGSLMPDGPAVMLLSERLRLPAGSIDFTGMNFYQIEGSSGRGWLSSSVLLAGGDNFAVGAVRDSERATAAAAVQFDDILPVNGKETIGVLLAVEAPTFTANGSTPQIHPLGVVNGASFAQAPNPISPESIVSVFGSNFSPAGTVAATGLPLSTELGQVSVSIGGQRAPLFFVSDGQINIQVPPTLAPGLADIVVQTPEGETEPLTVRIASTSPGVFQATTPESFYGAVMVHPNGDRVTAANPAYPGQTVVLFVHGLGRTQGPNATGQAYGSTPLPALRDSRVRVYFSGIAGDVLYAGGTPGFVGLQQVNVRIPEGVATGLNVPVAVQTLGAFHDQTDIPIASSPALSDGDKNAPVPELDLPPRVRVVR